MIKSLNSHIKSGFSIWDRGLAFVLSMFVRLYQRILSPDHSIWARALARPPYCRHIPSCSDYAIQALQTHGGFKWGWLALCRIGRCVPWRAWGYDPVPQKCWHIHHKHD